MANNSDQRDLLRELVVAAVQLTDIPLTRVKFPNAPFTTPNNETWLRASWLPGVAEFWSYGVSGSGKNIVAGICQVDIFTPKGQSDKAAYNYADTIAQSMANQQVFEGNFQLDTLQATVRPMEEEDTWFGLMVEVQFRALHIR